MEWDKLLCDERRRPVGKKVNSTDERSEFEKDYHRIIGSASFRRLQDKTQVFPLDKSDFIRTRLTHSLEVSSFSKSLGQSVGNDLVKKGEISVKQAQSIADILLCAGLLHDIGNPPFGHFGETVIREWFCEHLDTIMLRDKSARELLTPQQAADLCHFEGNAQSFRVVTRLHRLVDENGMNLTKGLLNTIIKYPVSSIEIDKNAGDIRLKKMGYFAADKAAYDDVVSSTGAGSRRHPLTYLLEAADDIAYSTADLEDGFKKGVLTFTRLSELIEHNPYEKEFKGTFEYSDCESAVERLNVLYNRAKQRGEQDPELYAVQNWVISLQGYLIRAVEKSFSDHYDELMQGTYKADLFNGTSSHYLVKVLKETAFKYIFQINPIVKLEIAANRILGSLLEQFVEAAVKYDTDVHTTEPQRKLMQLISPNYMRIYEEESQAEGMSEGDKLYLRLLLVTDFVAGMTDHYAQSLYQELSGIY